MTIPIYAIKDTDDVWRRIPPDQVVTDAKVPGGMRPSTAAFNNSSDGSPMSVVVEPVAIVNGLGPGDAIAGKAPGMALVGLETGTLRGDNQLVFHSPDTTTVPPEPCAFAHGSVDGRKPKSVRNRWSLASRWVVPPR